MEHPLAIAGKLLFYDSAQAAKVCAILSISAVAPLLDVWLRLLGFLVALIVGIHTMLTNHRRLQLEKKKLENELKNKNNV